MILVFYFYFNLRNIRAQTHHARILPKFKKENFTSLFILGHIISIALEKNISVLVNFEYDNF